MLPFPVCHWAGGSARIPLFNGTDNNLRRSSALSGVTDSKLALLFISFKPTAGILFDTAGIRIGISESLGDFQITVNIGDGFHLIGTAVSTLLDTGEWGTLLIEFDMDDFGTPPGEVHVARTYINDGADVFATSFGNHGVAMPNTDAPNRIGSSDTDTGFYSGCIEKLWFSVGENVDLTVPANRLKWYNADLTPKDLGPNGENPTGTSPALYLTSASRNFNHNLGTGGAFVGSGAPFLSCGTNPTDNPPDA